MSQFLQPWAQSFQILNGDMAWDIPVQTIHTRLAKLPERKVLGEVDRFVDTYFCHTIFIQNYQFHRCYGVTALRCQRMTLPVFLNTALVVPFSTKSPAFSMK